MGKKISFPYVVDADLECVLMSIPFNFLLEYKERDGDLQIPSEFLLKVKEEAEEALLSNENDSAPSN